MEWLVITVLFPFLFKYSFVITNQFTQVPFILRALDSAYLANDWYVNTFTSFGPRTFFTYYMMFWTKIAGLPFAFFLNYVVSIGLISYATFHLSLFLTKSRIVALFSTVTILFGSSITLGGNMLVTRDFTAPQLPLSLMLCSLFFTLQKKYIFAFGLAIIASYFHPLIGFEMTAIIFSTYVLNNLFEKRIFSISLKNSFYRGFFMYALLLLPLFIGYIIQSSGDKIPSDTLLSILAYSRTPHHYLPSVWDIGQFSKFFTMIGLTIYVYFRWQDTKLKETYRFLGITIVLIFGLCIVSFIGTEIIPVYHIVEAQLFRNTLLVYWLCITFIFSTLFSKVINNEASPIWLTVPVFLTNFNFSLAGKSDIIALLVLVFSIFIFKKINKYFVILLLVVGFSFQNLHELFNYDKYFTHSTSETSLSLWAKNNTALHSLFIVPPEFEKFRLLSERAIIADWKAIPFQSGAMNEWAIRMCDLANTSTNCQYRLLTINRVIDGYRTHTDQTLTQLGNKYNADFLISDVEYNSLPILLTEGSYHVYQLH